MFNIMRAPDSETMWPFRLVCLKENLKIHLWHKNGGSGVYTSGDSEVGQGFRAVMSYQIVADDSLQGEFKAVSS